MSNMKTCKEVCVPIVSTLILMTAFCNANGEQAPLKAEPFKVNQVRLLDGPFKDAMERDQKYLLSLDPDRLLHSFRMTAGLTSTARPLGGWEKPDCELRGHTLGHYLTACALMYGSTGDKALLDKADYLVAELAKCQEALPSQGYNKGFLSAYPESFFDRVDKCERVWAPYYTLHKIMAGLLDAHLYLGNRQAIAVLENMAGWLKFRVDRLTPEQMQRTLQNEHGGMNEVLANLYEITGNPDHLSLARSFNHEAIFKPLSLGEDKLDGLHANTQIPKIIGAAREHELTGEPSYKVIASTFWERVALYRSYVIGGHSDHECFFPIDQFSRHLGTDTCETCNTYNMLKLTRHLFEWEPMAEKMDFYERALYNHILASQDPEQGMFVYLMSLKPGHFKTYSTPEDSFWCCVGTGMENHAKYGDTIYFHKDDSLYVNLFIASELTWKEKGLVIRQETSFPQSDKTQLMFKCERPTELSLKIRYPAWAKSGMTISVNKKPQKIQAMPGSYVVLKREWADNDQVEIHLPMSLHLEALPGNPDTVAILYGPLVLAGELGTSDMPSPYAKGQTDLNKVASPEVPVFVCGISELISHIQPLGSKPLAFQTKGIGKPRDVSLIPFYQLHHQRYSVYWQVYSTEEWKKVESERAAMEARRKALEARIVDDVKPGEQQSETDHNLKGQGTRSGDFRNLKWRDANNGGWFSYELKVLPEVPMILQCTYWGSEEGGREFDVLIDDTKIATQTLGNNKPNEFFAVEHPIPAELSRGKEKVVVKFKAHDGRTAGGVFGCVMLKADQH